VDGGRWSATIGCVSVACLLPCVTCLVLRMQVQRVVKSSLKTFFYPSKILTRVEKKGEKTKIEQRRQTVKSFGPSLVSRF